MLKEIPLETVTDAFLALESPESAKQFFERYGEWGTDERTDQRRSTITWSEVLKFQKMLRRAFLADFGNWDEEIRSGVFDLELRPDMKKDHPSLFLTADNVKDHLLTHLLFVSLSGLPVGFCVRKDCGKVFQKFTKHERKFCSTECAHIEYCCANTGHE